MKRAPTLALLMVSATSTSAFTLSACFFAPNVEQFGYTSCESDGDCLPGRYCDEKLCSPPPWNDTGFADRRPLIVTNESAEKMAAGTAVPVVIGEPGGLLAIAEVRADFRFTDFDPATRSWNVRSVFLDREDARFTAWIPTSREILQGRSDVLAWIESETEDGQLNVIEDPFATFTVFEGFEGSNGALNEDVWSVRGDVGIDGGLANIADNENILLNRPLTTPILVEALVRINEVTCDEVFVGFIGDDDSLFPIGPGAGLSVVENRAAVASVGPIADGILEPNGDVQLGGAFTRVSVNVHDAGVRVVVDGEVVHENLDVRPPFEDLPMFFTIQVNGACSVDVDAVWLTPLPLPSPSVIAGDLVEFKLF